jgi:hypothetical protein
MLVVTALYLRVGHILTSRIAQLVPTKATASPAFACGSDQLRLTGADQDCIKSFQAMSCPTGSYDQARVVHLHGTTGNYILYVEVRGAYHGPAAYSLAPWPHPSLGVSDGVAKVAVREWTSGAMWQSTSGTLTIARGEETGTVSAVLTGGGGSNADQLHIAGRWMCP